MRNILKLYSGTQSGTPVSPKKIVDFEKKFEKKLCVKKSSKKIIFVKK